MSADNGFPYRMYTAARQESGSGIASHPSNDGQMGLPRMAAVAAEEYGDVVADPLNEPGAAVETHPVRQTKWTVAEHCT